ncbi:MAG TPA: DUF1127 domain-containing protein [Acidiphilium sp.]|nr:DUF1127 domain-containing protein [Acidiphilium sp.]HQU24295.1 DUF1127 domain-containing protein [Acidiphilium sp.]
MSTTLNNRRRDVGAAITSAVATQDEAIAAAFRENAHQAANLFERGRNLLAQFRARRSVMLELSQLNDRELADIGLTRGDIPGVASDDFGRRL